ncbi:hypothetical protein AB4K20DRAFT_1870178 [Rhizopus microsporus]
MTIEVTYRLSLGSDNIRLILRKELGRLLFCSLIFPPLRVEHDALFERRKIKYYMQWKQQNILDNDTATLFFILQGSPDFILSYCRRKDHWNNNSFTRTIEDSQA